MSVRAANGRLEKESDATLTNRTNTADCTAGCGVKLTACWSSVDIKNNKLWRNKRAVCARLKWPFGARWRAVRSKSPTDGTRRQTLLHAVLRTRFTSRRLFGSFKRAEKQFFFFFFIAVASSQNSCRREAERDEAQQPSYTERRRRRRKSIEETQEFIHTYIC